jgi:hypothetical protein
MCLWNFTLQRMEKARDIVVCLLHHAKACTMGFRQKSCQCRETMHEYASVRLYSSVALVRVCGQGHIVCM